MDLKKVTYLFYGHGCEYVLGPVYEAMKSEDYNCIEINTLSMDIEEILPSLKKLSLKKKKIVFITSAHLLLDHHNFTYFYETDHKIYSPLEIISILKPDVSIFMPHDLSSPVGHDEFPYLSLFDLCLLPWKGLSSLANYTDCIVSGWPKAGIESDEEIIGEEIGRKKPSYKAIWFISNIINHLDRGFDHFLNWMTPLTSRNVAVKLPQWTKVKEVEDKLTAAGITVIPCETNIFKAMDQTTIVITNGASSVVTESCLYGKNTICIKSDCEREDSVKLFGHLPNLTFANSPEDIDLDKIISEAGSTDLENNNSLLEPFSIDTLLKAIQEII